MRDIFLADAHLLLPTDHNYRMLLRFLDELRGSTGTLYILGDLFDFWVGLPGMPLPEYRPVIDALDRLRSGGTGLVYFEGNHDFRLGRVFDRLQCRIHEEPAVLSVQGKQLLLCHGDQLNPFDRDYHRLRKLLRSLPMRLAISICPPVAAQAVRHSLQRHSRRGYVEKQGRWDYRSIIRQAALQYQKAGLDGMVCGHFHLPAIEQLDQPPFTLVSLGDWITDFSYAEMTDGVLSLRQYSPT